MTSHMVSSHHWFRRKSSPSSRCFSRSAFLIMSSLSSCFTKALAAFTYLARFSSSNYSKFASLFSLPSLSGLGEETLRLQLLDSSECPASFSSSDQFKSSNMVHETIPTQLSKKIPSIVGICVPWIKEETLMVLAET